jgi:cardiolipin synthase
MSRFYYYPFLNFAPQVKIYEYQGIFNHSKLFLIDDDITILGTSNFDYRSLYYDLQTSLIVYDVKLNNQLQQNLINDLQHTFLITKQNFKLKR